MSLDGARRGRGNSEEWSWIHIRTKWEGERSREGKVNLRGKDQIISEGV
jgi:hypothetical protein